MSERTNELLDAYVRGELTSGECEVISESAEFDAKLRQRVDEARLRSQAPEKIALRQSRQQSAIFTAGELYQQTANNGKLDVRDLGLPGREPVYGRGLVLAPKRCG